MEPGREYVYRRAVYSRQNPCISTERRGSAALLDTLTCSHSPVIAGYKNDRAMIRIQRVGGREELVLYNQLGGESAQKRVFALSFAGIDNADTAKNRFCQGYKKEVFSLKRCLEMNYGSRPKNSSEELDRLVRGGIVPGAGDYWWDI
jgi:hypothetical protein